MCGIWLWIHPKFTDAPAWQEAAKQNLLWMGGARELTARGPEGHRWLHVENGMWCFTRLAINGLTDAGMQPFNWNDRWVWMCNGEIYNHVQLEGELGYLRVSGSDCEVIGALYETYADDPVTFARALDGVFALAVYDKAKQRYVVARDPYGVRPLFYMKSTDGSWRFASERKALEPFVVDVREKIFEFPPGEVWTLDVLHDAHNGDHEVAETRYVYHTVPWLKHQVYDSESTQPLRQALEKAVEKRVQNTERQVAALLSGGIDSSLIASLVQREGLQAGRPPLKTFSIGMEGGTDLKYARMVADWIKSEHHEILVTADEMFDSIPEVVWRIESYDITTVRASVGNFLVAKAVREQSDCKVLFNGDGSDEVFGSYLYFYKAPSDTAFEAETRRLLENIHKYDVLRSDRSISSHGLEARTPFLDKQFVSVAMSYPTHARRPSAEKPEKWLLRKAFDDGVTLPSEVLWRKKEAFSDGVSAQEKSWFEIIQEKIEERGLVPENWQEIAKEKCWFPLPHTKEAFYYRSLFEKDFTHTGSYWPFWMPKWSTTTDPSARTL